MLGGIWIGPHSFSQNGASPVRLYWELLRQLQAGIRDEESDYSVRRYVRVVVTLFLGQDIVNIASNEFAFTLGADGMIYVVAGRNAVSSTGTVTVINPATRRNFALDNRRVRLS